MIKFFVVISLYICLIIPCSSKEFVPRHKISEKSQKAILFHRKYLALKQSINRIRRKR